MVKIAQEKTKDSALGLSPRAPLYVAKPLLLKTPTGEIPVYSAINIMLVLLINSYQWRCETKCYPGGEGRGIWMPLFFFPFPCNFILFTFTIRPFFLNNFFLKLFVPIKFRLQQNANSNKQQFSLFYSYMIFYPLCFLFARSPPPLEGLKIGSQACVKIR